MTLPPSYEPYTPQEMTNLMAAFATIKTIVTPRAANIAPNEMKDIVKLGPERVLAVSLTAQAAVANPNAFPPGTVNPQELKDASDWHSQLEILQSETNQIGELISDTRTAAGSRAITLTLIAYGLLQSATKVIAGLNDVVRSIGEALRRKRPKNDAPGIAA